MTKRFAIYYAPAESSPLSRLAASWLGRDAFRGPCPPETVLNGFTGEVWRAATADPRVYGFHATLKPPFRLSDPATEPDLFRGLQDFAATQRSFEAPCLKVSPLSAFLALTLSEPCPTFEALAADCVREFDSFRAPPTDEELARRRISRLSARQIEYLHRWGYPYVMDEWRFHMTLTSSLESPLLQTVQVHLEDLFSPYCRAPLMVDSICLFEQPGPGQPFHVAERFGLS